MQNTLSNYDTDAFKCIFEKLTEIASDDNGKIVYKGRIGADDIDQHDTTCRIIVDHIRTVCICLSDDVIPGHQTRHNVLRHILRRAICVQYAYCNAI